MSIRLAIVNDYEVVVHGLASMLRSYSDRIQVVEMDATTDVGVRVDIVLYDTFAQGVTDRARIAGLVADPGVDRVVVYTWHPDDAPRGLGGNHGVAAYLSKQLTAAELVAALEDVHHGREVRIFDSGRRAMVGGDWPGREEGLTARESEVLSLITQGLSNAEIVETTALSINSIKSYIRSGYRKVGVTTRSKAILWGIEHGLTPDRIRVSNPRIPGSDH
ncbi:MAG: response regulator transcription factor [Nocardioides sp.]